MVQRRRLGYFTYLSSGDLLTVSDVSCTVVTEPARETPSRRGIEVPAVNMFGLATVAAAIRPNTRLIYVRSVFKPWAFAIFPL